jgi:glycosyltransferase involved in cell wall biosynthesis
MIWLAVTSSYIGGVERHIATLAQSFRRRGIAAEIILFGNYANNPWIAQLQAVGLGFRVLEDDVGAMVRALREHKPDLLHAHGYKACILGRIAARLTGTRIVTSNHEPERGLYPVSLYRRIDDWTGFLSTNISVSEAIQRRFPFKSHHLPNYAPLPPSVAARPLPRHVALVGRLVDVKRPDLFCEIARRAPAGLSWHVYGDGPHREKLQKAYGDIVTFHGTIEDMTQVWPNVGLLLMPSAVEGHPYAALEALGEGIPVLASKVDGIVGTVVPGLSGWLFDYEDVEGALRGLKAWMALDEAGQIAQRRACWEFVTGTFSEAVILPRLLAIYREAGYEPVAARAAAE